MAKCFECGKEMPHGKVYRIKGKKARFLCRNCWKKRPRDWQILLGLILMIVIITLLVLLKRKWWK